MIKFFIFFLFFVPTLSLAQDFLHLSQEERDPEAQEVLIQKPEKFLRNESMIYDLNTNIGIKDQRRYTGNDRNRVSLAGHISSDYEHPMDILGLEFTYMKRSTRYNQIWYGFQFFQHRTYFDAITQNQEAETGDNSNDESQFNRPGNTKNTILAGGLGVGYRFKLLLDFFQTEDMFESIDVFANYLNLNETFIGKKYNGYGLTTNYGLHKRVSTNYFYGGKLSYNLATVTRPALGNEKPGDRSFALGWLSVAFELGLFF